MSQEYLLALERINNENIINNNDNDNDNDNNDEESIVEKKDFVQLENNLDEVFQVENQDEDPILPDEKNTNENFCYRCDVAVGNSFDKTTTHSHFIEQIEPNIHTYRFVSFIKIVRKFYNSRIRPNLPITIKQRWSIRSIHAHYRCHVVNPLFLIEQDINKVENLKKISEGCLIEMDHANNKSINKDQYRIYMNLISRSISLYKQQQAFIQQLRNSKKS